MSGSRSLSPDRLAHAVTQGWCEWADCRGWQVQHTSFGTGTIDGVTRLPGSGVLINVAFEDRPDVTRFEVKGFRTGKYLTAVTIPDWMYELILDGEKQEAAEQAAEAAQEAAQARLEQELRTEQEGRAAEQHLTRVQAALAQYGIDRLYYMAHAENVPSIMHHGILSRNQVVNRKLLSRDFSWPEVQDLRKKPVPCYRKRPVHSHVNLYFAFHTPMQYVLTHENREGRQPLAQEELIFIEIDPLAAFAAAETVFSDGNVADSETRFHTDIESLKYLDWDIIDSYRATTPERKRCKAAEVLVPDRVPPEWFMRVVVYDLEARNWLNELIEDYNRTHQAMVRMACPCACDPRLYY